MSRGPSTSSVPKTHSPLLFLDSDEDDKGVEKENRKVSIPKRENPLSPKSKVKKYLDEHLGEPHEPTKMETDAGTRYGNKYDKKASPDLFLPPASVSSSRKRTHPEQSTARVSTSSVGSNSSKTKVPLKSSVSLSAKGSGVDESCYSDFCSDDDFGSTSGRSKVAELIGKLGTEIQQKVRAKKQKLAEQFKGVNAIPLNFHRISSRHAEERQKLIDTLRSESEKVQERMENMVHLGAVQYEKHEKCMAMINQGSEEVRKAIEDVIKMQANLYAKFTQDLKAFDEKHTQGLTGLTEMCEHSLRDLHTQLQEEIVKTETETLTKIKV